MRSVLPFGDNPGMETNKEATMNALSAPLPSAIDPSFPAKKNARLAARLAYAREQGQGYLTCSIGHGNAVHAAIKTTRGWGGHDHPRALCQPHSPRFFAVEHDPVGDDRAVTCQRCLAGLEKRS